MKRDRVKIDLIIVGNANSGKTSLIKRYVEGEESFSHFYNPTIGLNLQKKIITIGERSITVCIWDTAGQQKYTALTKNYFKKAHGVIVVFDLTDKNTFEKIQKYWMNQVHENTDEDCPVVLIGNKLDMHDARVIPPCSARQMAAKFKIPYHETSAKTGENVEKAIDDLIHECLKKADENENKGSGVNLDIKRKQDSCFSNPKNYISNWWYG